MAGIIRVSATPMAFGVRRSMEAAISNSATMCESVLRIELLELLLGIVADGIAGIFRDAGIRG